jgi:putative endonuclease
VSFFMHYVYIIQSERDGTFYKGYSTNPLIRIEFHNKGLSTYTKNKTTWKLVAILGFSTKTEALQKEKKLKKYNRSSLNALINSNQNMINQLLPDLENR